MGRGLAAILPRSPRDSEGLRELPVELVEANPSQPRRDFDPEALLALSESIRARGVLQPIVVRPLHGGGFELIAGERRLRAAKMAGLESIPAIVRVTEEGERLELALIENMAREDLNPVEEARACATLVEDLGVTKEELGRRVGRSRVAISNLIRLLDLPDEALELLEAGELSEGHGRAILMCKDQTERRRLARAARTKGWSVRETEKRAKEAEEGGPAQPRKSQVVIHPDLSDLVAAAEDALTAALAREVKVRIVNGRCRVEFELDDPREAVEMAARLLHQPAA
jgi:ParB family transcriptional regulator, chromosome partitioning protein